MTTKMVLRGGCWYGSAGFCRSAFLFRYSPPARSNDLGFRVVKEKKKEKKIEYRVNRGGSWVSTADNCRSANRLRDSPADRSLNLGFRVIKENKDDN